MNFLSKLIKKHFVITKNTPMTSLIKLFLTNNNNIKIWKPASLFVAIMFLIACNSGNSETKTVNQTDTVGLKKTEAAPTPENTDSASKNNAGKAKKVEDAAKVEMPVVLIYNFHVTNRCPSCIAIEEATTKTLKKFFSSELNQGRIKRQILNVDDEANKKISEKYQAFGSGLLICRIFKGKETTTDLTGDGFKYAKNKEEKFIDILKQNIAKALKN